MRESTKKLLDYLNEQDYGYEKYGDMVIISNTLEHEQLLNLVSKFPALWYDGSHIQTHVK